MTETLDTMLTDFDGWASRQPSTVRSAIDQQLANVTDDQKDAEKQRIASMMAVSSATGLDPQTVADKWDVVRGGFAENLGPEWSSVKDDDAKFYGKLRETAQQRIDERSLIYGTDKAPADSLYNKAREAAYTGKSYADALSEWEQSVKGKPGYADGRAADYADFAARAHQQMAETLDKARPIAQSVYDTIAASRDGQGGNAAPFEAMRGLSGNEKATVFRLMRDRADSTDAGAGKLDWQAFGEAIGRSFENMTLGGGAAAFRARLLESNYKEGDTVTAPDALAQVRGDYLRETTARASGGTAAGTAGLAPGAGRVLTAEEAKQWNAQVDSALEDLDTGEQLRQFGQQVIDPTNKAGGLFFQKVTLPMADSAALLSAMALPGALAPVMELNARQYQNQEYDRLRGLGMDRAQASSMALVTGTAQAALDKVELEIFKGLGVKVFPGTFRALEQYALKGSTLGKFAVRTAATTAGETLVELAQDQLVPALVQDNASTDPRFDVQWGEVWRDTIKAAPETALGMVLLSGLFGAVQTHAQNLDVRQLTDSGAAMRLRGYTVEQIDAIKAAPDEQKASLLAQYLPEKAPTGAEAEKLRTEALAMYRQEQAAFEEKRRAEVGATADALDGAVRVTRSGSGWWVQFGDKSVSVSDAEAAVRLRDDLKQAEKAKDAEAFVALVNAWTQSAPEGVNRQTTVTGEVVRPAQDGAALSRVDVRTGEERIQPLDEASMRNLHEQSRMDAQATGNEAVEMIVNGTNQVFREQVGERAGEVVQRLEINQGDSAITTFLHESFEADAKAAIASGAVTAEEIQAAIAKLSPAFDPAKARMPEERAFRERVQRVANGEANESEVRETLTELAVADTYGRRKDGGAFPAGSVSAGLERMVRTEIDPQAVRAVGKIRAFIQAVKTKLRAIFGTIAALRKARKDGGAESFDALISKITGTDAQVAHEAAAAQEALSYVAPSEADQAAGIAFSLSRVSAETLSDEELRILESAQKAGLAKSAIGSVLELAGAISSVDGERQGLPQVAEAIQYFSGPDGWSKKSAIDTLADRRKENESDPRSSGIVARIDSILSAIAPAGEMKQAQFDFRLSAGSRLEALQKRIDAALSRDPERRRDIARRAIAKLETLQFNAETLRFTAKGDAIRPLVEKRTTGELDKEQAMRQAIRADELTQEKIAALSAETRAAYEYGRTKLDEHPTVQGLLEDGRLMSRSESIRRGRESEYDGVPWLPPSWYGGSIMPDQAAQLLYDKGLLREASPDALWKALGEAVESIRKQNTAFESASTAVKEATRQARNQAREEAANWRADEDKRQAKDWSPRAELVRDLRSLDAILSVLPAEIRGKVGGFTKIASLATDQARLKEIQRRIVKMSGLLEKHLQAESVKALEALIEKAAPAGGPGERAAGKITVDGHRVFAAVERVWRMSEAEATAEKARIAAAIEAEASTGATESPKMLDLLEEQQLVDAFANFEGKTAADMDAAVRWLTSVYETGRNAWRESEAQRLGQIADLRAEIIATLGSPTLAGRQKQKAGEKLLGKLLENGSLDLLSWVQVLENFLGPDHATVKRWNQAARSAAAQKTDAVLAANGRFESALSAALPKLSSLERRQRLWTMTTEQSVEIRKREGVSSETLDVPREKVQQFADGTADPAAFGFTAAEAQDLIDQLADPALAKKKNLSVTRANEGTVTPAKLTEMEAIALTMLARQEQYARNFERHGYDADALDDAEKGISPEGLLLRAFFAKEYANGYEPLARLFREMYGIDLPRVANYSPATFYHLGEERATDPFGGGLLPDGGFRSGFLKERKQHAAEPRIENAFSVWRGHVAATEHWRAFAPFVRELRSVFGNPEMKSAIEAAHGQDMAGALNRWVDAFEQNGLHERTLGRVVDGFTREITRRQATLTLAWKAGTVFKQTLAVLNSASRVPLGSWLRGFSRVMRGKVDVSAIYNSPMIQRRIESGYSPEVRAAMVSLFNGKPTRWADFVTQGLENLGRVDAFFTSIGTAIVFDHAREQGIAVGLSEDEATRQALVEAEDSIGRTAQPTEMPDRSIYELGMSPLEKVGFMFASEARKNTALLISAARLYKDGKIDKAQLLRVVAVAWLANGLGSALIGAAWRDATDDDDDSWLDWEHWNPVEMVKSTLLGPLAGVPMLNILASSLLGFSNSGPFQPVARAVASGSRLLEGDKTEPVEKTTGRVIDVLNGAAMLFPQVEAIAVGGNIFKQVLGLVDNFTPDTAAERARKDRAATKR